MLTRSYQLSRDPLPHHEFFMYIYSYQIPTLTHHSLSPLLTSEDPFLYSCLLSPFPSPSIHVHVMYWVWVSFFATNLPSVLFTCTAPRQSLTAKKKKKKKKRMPMMWLEVKWLAQLLTRRSFPLRYRPVGRPGSTDGAKLPLLHLERTPGEMLSCSL